MNPPTAVLDACVLYSASLRDLFMWLAIAEMYVPKWTEQIHEEWMRNVLENRPDLTHEKLDRTRILMNLHAEGSLVTDYEHLIPTVSLPDANDRHVLAAAIASEATGIVTFNLSDFPQQVLAAYGMEALHPDVFLTHLFDQKPEVFMKAIHDMVSELKNPPRTLEQHLEILRAQGLEETAEHIAQRLKERDEQQ